MLRVEHLRVRAGDFSLRDVSFTVEDGAYFVLLGASGAGKTVLLEALAGLAPVREGRILLHGADITRARIRHRGFGLVYQDRALFPHLTVRRNIAYGLHARRMPRALVRDRVEELARETGTRELLRRYPATLSGGEAQRVALARALATQPQCLLLDEPLSALDAHARGEMRALLRAIHRGGRTILHVTHDYEEALSLATQVGVIEDGTIRQTGPPGEVFRHPRSEFVARFVGIRNIIEGRLETPAEDRAGEALFVSNGLSFHTLTDAPPGPGLLLVRSEDVTLSLTRPESSARNCFPGTIREIVPARLGVEVYVDAGVEIAALVTPGSVERIGLREGLAVWVSFKAGAARFIGE
ncbi:MAG TPA: ABC transporter ATP-binding protein [Candidatus Hydrogenedentes bacterium]|nr:ABC transporter ATP-binding protein [Candidatus Hydrogenedentota bacterium]